MEEKISALIAAAEEKLAPAFKRLEAIEEIGTRRVLAAFQEHQVAYRHLRLPRATAMMMWAGTPWKRFLPTFLGRRRPLFGRTLPRVHTPFPFACLA